MQLNRRLVEDVAGCVGLKSTSTSRIHTVFAGCNVSVCVVDAVLIALNYCIISI